MAMAMTSMLSVLLPFHLLKKSLRVSPGRRSPEELDPPPPQSSTKTQRIAASAIFSRASTITSWMDLGSSFSLPRSQSFATRGPLWEIDPQDLMSPDGADCKITQQDTKTTSRHTMHW